MVISPEIVRDYIEQLADQIQDWIRREPVDVTVESHWYLSGAAFVAALVSPSALAQV